MKKVVLAYSGGLDTSFCVKYLTKELGYEVYTALANTAVSRPRSWPPSRSAPMRSAPRSTSTST